MTKVYAVGFKNWVEIRVASKPPVSETDEVKKVIIEKQAELVIQSNGQSAIKISDVEVPWVIKTTHFEGGRVIYTLKTSRLKYLGVYVGDQKCVELSKENVQKLISGGLNKLSKYIK